MSAGSARTQAVRRQSQTFRANIQSDKALVRPIDRQERLSRNNTMIVAAQTNHLESFLHKAETKTLTSGIIGLGYVGLPLAQLFSSQGFNVIGFDIDESKVRKLMNGES